MNKSSLKILLVSVDYRPSLGGIATCSYEVSRALSQFPGAEVKVLTLKHPNGDEFDAHGYFQTSRFKGKSHGIFGVLKLSLEVLKVILTWKPHAIVHFLWLPEGVATWLLAPFRFLFQIPYFVVVHGVEVVETNRNWRKKLRNAFSPIKHSVLRNAARVFSVSQFTANYMIQNCHLRSDHVKIIGNGVNRTTLTPQPKAVDLVEKYKLSGKTVFFTLTRLEDYKGVDRVIAAMRRVVAQYPNTVYLISGEGIDRSRLDKLVVHYRLQSNVIFTGRIPFDRLSDYYSIADCFMMVSRDDWETPNVEGFGLVYLEAAACKVPSIGGRAGGIADAVVDGETGWLVDPTDDHAVANVMMQVIQDPEECRRRGIKAYTRAVNDMSWENVADRIYSEVTKHVRN
jgi:phosphatidyl-myo-inositol dimannoside synthase